MAFILLEPEQVIRNTGGATCSRVFCDLRINMKGFPQNLWCHDFLWCTVPDDNPAANSNYVISKTGGKVQVMEHHDDGAALFPVEPVFGVLVLGQDPGEELVHALELAGGLADQVLESSSSLS